MPAATVHQTLILQLRTEIDRLYDRAADPSSPPFRSKFDEVVALWEKLRDVVQQSKSGDISEFFHAIGSGVIDAQKRLDRASQEYVRGLLSGPEQPGASSTASLFRIPRVTAELKCSLESSHEKKLNLVFYSDRNDVRELHQQSIQLEVVAVPVPPDYLQELQRVKSERQEESSDQSSEDAEESEPREQTNAPKIFSIPTEEEGAVRTNTARPRALMLSEPDETPASDQEASQGMKEPEEPNRPLEVAWLQQRLVDEREREEVRSVIEKLSTSGAVNQSGTESLSPVQRFLLPSWERALVLSDGHNARFIFLALTDQRPRLLLWQLVLRPASLQLLYKLPRQKTPQHQLSRLHRLVEELGDSQKHGQPSSR